MPELVDAIYRQLVQDPDFTVPEGKSKDEAAWSEAWKRFRQHENNEQALGMEPEEEVEKHDTLKPHKHESNISNFVDKWTKRQPWQGPKKEVSKQENSPNYMNENQGKMPPFHSVASKIPSNTPTFKRMKSLAGPMRETGQPPQTAIERLQKWLQLATNDKPLRQSYVRNPFSGRQVKKKIGVTMPMDKQQPPRPGLVPQSGDPMHPRRWVRPSSPKEDVAQRKVLLREIANKVKRGELSESYLSGASYIDTEKLANLLGYK